MGKVIASITVSVDGYVTGPDDRPGQGLGRGGERLHHWVFGGPWTYDSERDLGGMSPEDRAFYEPLVAEIGAGVCGRGMYDAAGAWGGTNPFPGRMFVVTHGLDDAPPVESGFTFVGDLATALAWAGEEAGSRAVSLAGGADVIRQALAASLADELVLSTAPVVLGGGKRLFDGFEHDVELEILSVHPAPYATHVRYAVGTVGPAH
ncbi:MAG TPA: dihydrofolate reductase family protein [Nocardioides sp.]|uniref:dihydrofolate reductase family protein n=1 Tax=Nocardioides sp. TaxID=35761 RepID=UPI002C1E3F3F|nr:dihydrofolate reductase family protein [Nocardioides sp.]HTW14633.1 dihydrofolate reductase family protein [Nocardioides sp.]